MLELVLNNTPLTSERCLRANRASTSSSIERMVLIVGSTQVHVQQVMQSLSSSQPLSGMLQSSQRGQSNSGAHSAGALSHWNLQPQFLRRIGSANKKLSVRFRPYAWDRCLPMLMLHSNGGCLLATLATKRPRSSDRASSVPHLKTNGTMESCSSLKDRTARASGLKYTSRREVLVPHGCCNWRFLAVLLQSKLFGGNLSSTLHCYTALQ